MFRGGLCWMRRRPEAGRIRPGCAASRRRRRRAGSARPYCSRPSWPARARRNWRLRCGASGSRRKGGAWHWKSPSQPGCDRDGERRAVLKAAGGFSGNDDGGARRRRQYLRRLSTRYRTISGASARSGHRRADGRHFPRALGDRWFRRIRRAHAGAQAFRVAPVSPVPGRRGLPGTTIRLRRWTVRDAGCPCQRC